MLLALSKNAASLLIANISPIDCTFSFRCKSAAIRQSSPFDSQSALADKINRFLTEQADRPDKGCGCRILRNDKKLKDESARIGLLQ